MPAPEAYMLSRDKTESQRLDLQHQWTKAIAGDRLIHPSIPLHSVKAIADVATGTGIWLRDLANTWQSTDNTRPKFVGFDISADQFPNEEVPGIELHVHNAVQPFPEAFLGKFDIVNVRLMTYAMTVSDITDIVSNIASIVKPGGYLQWQEFDTHDALAQPETSKARALISTVIDERVARGLFPAIATPLIKAIGSCSTPLPDGCVNPISWTGDVLRLTQVQSIPTENHPNPLVREYTDAGFKKTTMAILRSGAARRKAVAGSSQSEDADGELKIAAEMSQFADALESGTEDPGTSTWNKELTWIVARKAIFMESSGQWMSARYPCRATASNL